MQLACQFTGELTLFQNQTVSHALIHNDVLFVAFLHSCRSWCTTVQQKASIALALSNAVNSDFQRFAGNFPLFVKRFARFAALFQYCQHFGVFVFRKIKEPHKADTN